MEARLLKNWMTTPDIQLGTKITSTNEDEVYHSHDFYEIFYVLEGKSNHVINGDKHKLEIGNIVFLRPNDKHMFLRFQNTAFSHRDIIITPEQFEKTCRYIDASLFEKYNSSPCPLVTKLDLNQINHFESKLNTFINLPVFDKNIKKSIIINLLLSELMGIYVDSYLDIRPNFPSWFEELLGRFHMSDFIQDGLDGILANTNYDKSYICRFFKKNMGVTMSAYLCDMRLNYAATLIQSTDNSILQICNIIGFSSIAYFNTQFKRKFSCTPTEFRKKIKK